MPWAAASHHFPTRPWGRLCRHVVLEVAARRFRRCLPRQARSLQRSATRQACQVFSESATSGPGRELHTPVMVKEVLKCLEPQPGQVFLDMTFGAGGHSRAILQDVPGITIYALDRDPVAYQLAQQLSSQHPGQVHPMLGRFSELPSLLADQGLGPGGLDGVLLDAGCSSMQFDSPQRGFSLSKDGPLDMRMDGDRYLDMPTAADVVNALDQQALASILCTYGEEKHARKIASAIVEARSIYPITRTQQLASVVAGAFPAAALYARKDLLQRPAHVATKTFQALRIFVNDELHELHAGLQAARAFLRPGGRLAVLTFHSLEDRLAKRFLRGEDVAGPRSRSVRQKIRQGGREAGEEEEEEEEEEEPTRAGGWSQLQKKVMTPRPQDVEENPRGRSAKLRAAQKL
ncbi:12S rRNA N4-methylcytidine (m4C) methyltransferase [Lepisosteus oculatus]|uniref:12S rRNA N4-methylcytidine (m4C) methyltransferase n=1 Tax=Lepisosteus oculatus TaxID=7918 RepID=UPI0035F50834